MEQSTKTKSPGRRPRAAHATLTRRELAQRIQAKTGRYRAAGEMLEYVQAMLDCMEEAMLAGRHIEFRDFGVFEVVERKARLGRNPKQPQDEFLIPARRVIKFKAARKLIEKLAQPRKKSTRGKTR